MAEEESPGLIVFLRINIINVIQQSVLDEGATTPRGKIHSTSLIGTTIDRAQKSTFRFRCSASATGVQFSRVLENTL